MLGISFLSSLSFSIVLPSLWVYVRDLGGSTYFVLLSFYSVYSSILKSPFIGLDILGWAIALHSGGTILAGPLLVKWSQNRPLREVLVGTLFVMLCGGAMHGLAQNIEMLLAARFIIGAASANYVLTTVYPYFAFLRFSVYFCIFSLTL